MPDNIKLYIAALVFIGIKCSDVVTHIKMPRIVNNMYIHN